MILYSISIFNRALSASRSSRPVAALSKMQATKELSVFNTLGPRQNERQFTDDIFKCISVNENVWIPIKISLKFDPKGPINNIPALVPITIIWTNDG